MSRDMSQDIRRDLDVALTRTFRFAAAHYYYDPRLSETENRAAFGKCANRHGHGHNYRVDVTLAQGQNVLVLKVINEVNNWQACARFLQGSAPVKNLRIALAPQ